jgi:hypothetical protein
MEENILLHSTVHWSNGKKRLHCTAYVVIVQNGLQLFGCTSWLIMLTPSWVNCASSVNKIKWCKQGCAPNQGQNYNHLPMSTGSRFWIDWIRYGYNPSLCNVSQTLMHKTWRWAEILRALTCGLYSVISIMFTSSSTFYHTGRSAVDDTQKWATFLQMLVNMTKHTPIWDFSLCKLLPIFLNDSSGTAIAKPIHKMHICILFTGKHKWHIHSNLWSDTSHSMTWLHCLLAQVLLCAGLHEHIHTCYVLACMNTSTPAVCWLAWTYPHLLCACTSYISNPHSSVTIENWTHVHMTFLNTNDLRSRILKFRHKVTGQPVYIDWGWWDQYTISVGCRNKHS